MSNGRHWSSKKLYQAPAHLLTKTRIFCGSVSQDLAVSICQILGLKLSDMTTGRFTDGEVRVQINDSVRGMHTYVVQPVCRSDAGSVNDALVELLLIISTLRRASARRITAIMPYYGYARQDRKLHGDRVPISASEVARVLTAMGVDHVIAIDLHCGQIQGFFPPQVSVDNIEAGPIGAAFFSSKDLRRPVVVSPDAGGVHRAKEFARELDRLLARRRQQSPMAQVPEKVRLAMMVKQRSGPGAIESMDLVGEVRGCDCIICDDMVDTAGTLCRAAQSLHDHGARRVFAFATHGIFSGPAADRIGRSVLQEMVVVNTVPLPEACQSTVQIHQLDVAPVLAEAILRIERNQSVSQLWDPPLKPSRAMGQAAL